MSKARKSSIDGARRSLKAHIPYRADDFTHGKKTGVNVREVARRSDGFEQFGELLEQADAITPPHMRARRRKRSITPEDDEEDESDENGEMSMDIDDTMTTANFGAESPNMYFKKTPRPSAPTSANRSTATAIPSNRSSYIDYDRIPSPNPSTSSRRVLAQQIGSRTTPKSRLKSSLSNQTVVPSSPEDDGEDESDNEPFNDPGVGDDFGGGDYGGVDDFGGGDDGLNDDRPPSEISSPAAGRTSFTEIDQEDDEQPPVDNIRISSPPPAPSAVTPKRIDKGRGKRKESVAENGVMMEDEIAQGLAKIDYGGSDGESEEAGAGARAQKKKKRSREEELPKEKKKQVKRKKVQQPLVEFQDNDIRDGIRRGTRTRYKPLEYWRCEKVVYGRRDSGTSMVPVIKDIIRLPKEPPQPLPHHGPKRRSSSKPRSRSKPAQDDDEVMVFNPEEGWDDQTDPHGVVLDYQGGQEVQRRLAFTSKMVAPRVAANSEFLYQKIFGDGEFIAAGQLELPVGGKKPSKGTKDNTYVFYLIEGAINLKVHRTSFVLATGGMFLIPRGNTYYLENISQRPAKLFFAQARKVSAEDDPPPEVVRALPGGSAQRNKSVDSTGARRPSGKSGSLARSSSAAAPNSPNLLKAKDQKASGKRAVSK